MAIEIPGMTADYLGDFEVDTESIGKRFPFLYGKWTNHTAEARTLELSKDGKYLIVKCRNGEYSDWLYISIDPPKNGVSDAYLKRMGIILKTFDIYKIENGMGKLDPDRFEAAKGKLFRFGNRGALNDNGDAMYTEKGYPMINHSINGPAEKLEPVKEEAPPPARRTQAQDYYSTNDSYDGPSDIPF